ncbi:MULTISPECIES: hypothetical protein [unclassified Microcoleus]|uniref:hypothetical protein n=1 Tax=unclassified Microcoleus TaxID=2642155 RepID=UPI002FD69170
MKSKWTVYIGISLSVLAIIVAVTTPEVRYRLGLETNPSPKNAEIKEVPAPKDAEIKEVPVMVRTESLEPLASVNVEFTSQRGPATGLTDSNGYIIVKIPSTRDLQITLRKEGFETISETVDIKEDSVLTKKYILKKNQIKADLRSCRANTCTGRAPKNICDQDMSIYTTELVSFPELGEKFKNLNLEIKYSDKCHARWVKMPTVPGATIYFEGKDGAKTYFDGTDKKPYPSLRMQDDYPEPQVTGMLSGDIPYTRACVSRPGKDPQCTSPE